MTEHPILTPTETRQGAADFVAVCSVAGLRARLPLRWPAPADVAPSPKQRYRSHYQYVAAPELEALPAWQSLSNFELALSLIDFAPLRPLLAQLLGWTSAQGRVPFDPVSLFLLYGWQISEGWTRATTLRHLAEPRYAALRARLGFAEGVLPTEGGCRYFLTALGQHSPDPNHAVELPAYGDAPAVTVVWQRLNDLLIQAAQLLHQHDFLSDTAWTQALLCPDGMLHPAASHMRCTAVRATCYQPAPRPCPAREDKGRQGCACDTLACTQVCQHAPARDPEARYIWYHGDNHHPDTPNTPREGDPPTRGKGVYGYKSLALLLSDPQRRFHVTLLSDFGPAILNEADVASALLLHLVTHYPDLIPAIVAGDAAFGTARPLHLIYSQLHARRFVDLRAHASDRDPAACVARGYDARGRPLCPFGYALIANGFDPQRRRSKWFCGQQCLRPTRTPSAPLPDATYPPTECPFQDPAWAPAGHLVNLAETFPDQSLRLVRDAPVGSRLWKANYQRARNASEARNAFLERAHLKRLPYFGLPRNRALLALADTWNTLTTLARLCREATAATGACPT